MYNMAAGDKVYHFGFNLDLTFNIVTLSKYSTRDTPCYFPTLCCDQIPFPC